MTTNLGRLTERERWPLEVALIALCKETKSDFEQKFLIIEIKLVSGLIQVHRLIKLSQVHGSIRFLAVIVVEQDWFSRQNDFDKNSSLLNICSYCGFEMKNIARYQE